MIKAERHIKALKKKLRKARAVASETERKDVIAQYLVLEAEEALAEALKAAQEKL